MQEYVMTALGGLWTIILVMVLPAVKAALREWAAAEAQRALATIQTRLGEGAARIAGEIAAVLLAEGAVTATPAHIEAGTEVFHERYRETARKAGVSINTMRGMVAGELGKLRIGLAQ